MLVLSRRLRLLQFRIYAIRTGKSAQNEIKPKVESERTWLWLSGWSKGSTGVCEDDHCDRASILVVCTDGMPNGRLFTCEGPACRRVGKFVKVMKNRNTHFCQISICIVRMRPDIRDD